MIYKKIRDLREDSDLTQAEIAKVIGVSQRAYSYYENGERTLTPEILIKLSNYYNVSVDYILNITDNPNINR